MITISNLRMYVNEKYLVHLKDKESIDRFFDKSIFPYIPKCPICGYEIELSYIKQELYKDVLLEQLNPTRYWSDSNYTCM